EITAESSIRTLPIPVSPADAAPVRSSRRRTVTKESHLLLVRFLLVPALLAFAALSLLPVFSALADTTFQPGQTVIVVGTDGRGLKVRVGPGMAHRIVTTIAEGASVQIVAGPVSDGNDDWYQVSSGTAAAR